MKKRAATTPPAAQAAPTGPEPRPGDFDRTLLAIMRRLTPEERLEWLNSQLRAIEEVRRAVRA
jgi:hypothetical protein